MQKTLSALAKNKQPHSNPPQAKRHAQYPVSVRPMRKRHWALSGLLILGGSWITHTTTATISQEATDKRVYFNHLDDQQEMLPQATPLAFAPMATKSIAVKESTADKDQASKHNLIEAGLLAPKPLSVTEQLTSRKREIARGESLGVIFRREGLDLAIPHFISQHPVAKQLTSIRVGKELDFRFDEHETLKEIRYPVDALKELVVTLDGQQVATAGVENLAYETVEKTVSAEIDSSLYVAAQKAGLSTNLIMEMVRVFGWDVDFVQDIRVGDHFHLVFEEFHREGERVSDGPLLAAEFTTQGQTYRAVRFEDEEGLPSYFNFEGDSMLGTFLRSPVEFSRISSKFGMRKHPISKKWKAHKGVDYAAPRGTPIRATADGKVILAGRKGGYGKTVVLRHAGRFSTLYAHMNGYAKGIKSGVRVKQGQTIGYVGTTGMSTGPHLHYEFRVDGVHRNSLTYKTPKASSVKKENRIAFEKLTATYGSKLDQVKHRYELAKTEAEPLNTEEI